MAVTAVKMEDSKTQVPKKVPGSGSASLSLDRYRFREVPGSDGCPRQVPVPVPPLSAEPWGELSETSDDRPGSGLVERAIHISCFQNTNSNSTTY